MLLARVAVAEVLALNRDDCVAFRTKARVRGKGNKFRSCHRAGNCATCSNTTCAWNDQSLLAPRLFVSLKGRLRGTRMTPSGLAFLSSVSIGQTTRASAANPHRRHTFALT